MSRQTWVLLGVVAAAVVAAIVAATTDFRPPSALPATPLPVPVRDTSAPAVAARERPPAPRASAPAALRDAPSTGPEPVVAPEAPTMATLRISSDVPGAQVFIDRQFVGVAPVTADAIEPGTRQINVSAPGYDGVAEAITVAPGPRDVMVSLKAIRLDESVPVTHKHGFGSCSGRLVATTAGLRYETDNPKDGFSVPLMSLETFRVDFIAKNLKIKVKGGRSYDFTDPAGTADSLYLFHEAVEKARVRLAKGSGPLQESQ